MKSTFQIDETGKKYGRLTGLGISEKKKEGKLHWLCKCDCGNETEVIGYNLRKKITRSCGCLLSDHQRRYSYKYLKKPKFMLLDSDDEDIIR